MQKNIFIRQVVMRHGVESKTSTSNLFFLFIGALAVRMGALALEAGDKFIRGFVLYSGQTVVPFGKNLFAVPASILWSNH